MKKLILIPILFLFSNTALAHDWEKMDKLAWATSLIMSHDEIVKCGMFMEKNEVRKFKKLCNFPAVHAEHHNDVIAHYNAHKRHHPEMDDREFIDQHFGEGDDISLDSKENVQRRLWLEVYYFAEVQEILIQMYLAKVIIE